MSLRNIITGSMSLVVSALIILIVLAAGWYVAQMVKNNPNTMECLFGLGPKKNPTLCYAWSEKQSVSTR